MVVCLEQGADDLHINSMTVFFIFLFQIISVKKYFYVSYDNIFIVSFREAT